ARARPREADLSPRRARLPAHRRPRPGGQGGPGLTVVLRGPRRATLYLVLLAFGPAATRADDEFEKQKAGLRLGSRAGKQRGGDRGPLEHFARVVPPLPAQGLEQGWSGCASQGRPKKRASPHPTTSSAGEKRVGAIRSGVRPQTERLLERGD